MPRVKGTGPQGGGPMTGRGEGYCAVPQSRTGRISGYAGLPGRSIGGFFNRFAGRGTGRFFGLGRRLGRGMGRGRGRGRR